MATKLAPKTPYTNLMVQIHGTSVMRTPADLAAALRRLADLVEKAEASEGTRLRDEAGTPCGTASWRTE